MHLDGFNDDLLAGHRDLGLGAGRFATVLVWGMVAIGVIAVGAWSVQSGWVGQVANNAAHNQPGEKEKEKAEIHVGAGPIVQKAPEPKEASLSPVAVKPSREESAELNRLLAKLDRAEAKAAQGHGIPSAKRDKAAEKAETPMLVSKPKPKPKPEPVHGLAVEAPQAQVRQVEAAVIAKAAAREQESLLLFRKSEPAVGLPSRPAVARSQPAANPSLVDEPERPVVTPAPVLVVEETGVRVLGPEGERFIPIGGKLNGKHLLATSPKIGLILTEDQAIRVTPQEQR